MFTSFSDFVSLLVRFSLYSHPFPAIFVECMCACVCLAVYRVESLYLSIYFIGKSNVANNINRNASSMHWSNVKNAGRSMRYE